MSRILIVDDEALIRALLGDTLLDAGFEVKTAEGAIEALELCQGGECFDLGLCDVLMPSIDGHDLTRRIARRHPNVRVIHMSGFDPGCDPLSLLPEVPFDSEAIRNVEPDVRGAGDVEQSAAAAPTGGSRGRRKALSSK